MGLITYHFQVSPVNSTMLGYTVTEFQDGTSIAMEVKGCQVNAIGKATRPLFTDPATYDIRCSPKNNIGIDY